MSKNIGRQSKVNQVIEKAKTYALNVLKGRLRHILVSSGYLPEVIRSDVTKSYGIKLWNVYTNNVAGGMVSISYADDISQDHVGGVGKHCDLKLGTKNIEKYYYINSNYHDYDRSIGIAMIKGTGVAKISEADEFIDACDIVSVQSTGSIQIVGNKRTFIKLANKDMIYPEKLEAIYLTSKGIDSIGIYGDENFEFLVALVHLNRKHFELTVPEPDVQNMKEMTQNSLEAIANEYKLKPHEKLSKLYFIDDKFSISNGKYFK